MFYLLTPDGISITREAILYVTVKEAKKDFQFWKARYKRQGYYSSYKHGRINLDDLWHFMILNPKPFLIV